MQWDEVAEASGGGRTPAACLAQYQQKHKGTELLNSRWTPEEAIRLAQVIARLGTRDWQVVTPLHLSPLCNTRRNFRMYALVVPCRAIFALVYFCHMPHRCFGCARSAIHAPSHGIVQAGQDVKV